MRVVARSSQERRDTMPKFESRALHMIYESTFSTKNSAVSNQRLLSRNTSKFEIHVISLVVVLAQALSRRSRTSSGVHGSGSLNLTTMDLSTVGRSTKYSSVTYGDLPLHNPQD